MAVNFQFVVLSLKRGQLLALPCGRGRQSLAECGGVRRRQPFCWASAAACCSLVRNNSASDCRPTSMAASSSTTWASRLASRSRVSATICSRSCWLRCDLLHLLPKHFDPLLTSGNGNFSLRRGGVQLGLLVSQNGEMLVRGRVQGDFKFSGRRFDVRTLLAVSFDFCLGRGEFVPN